MKSKILVMAILTAFACTLSAQIKVISETESAMKEKNSTDVIYIDKDRARIETKSPEENTVVVIKDDPIMWIMNLNEGTYMEVTEEDMEKMKKQMGEYQKQMAPQMDEMRKMMEEQMKNMTPEQREMMKQHMPQGAMPGMPGMEEEKITYKKTDSGVKVNQWTCDKYTGYSDDQKVEEVWAANLSELNVSREDFKIFETFATFFEKFGAENAGAIFNIGSKEFEEEQGYPGLPVKTIYYDNGEFESKEEIKSIEKVGSFDDSLFKPKPGLKKTKNFMEQMGSGMPQN